MNSRTLILGFHQWPMPVSTDAGSTSTCGHPSTNESGGATYLHAATNRGLVSPSPWNGPWQVKESVVNDMEDAGSGSGHLPIGQLARCDTNGHC